MPPLPSLTRRAGGHAAIGGMRLVDVLADPRVSTPTYVYDVDAMVDEAKALSAGYAWRAHVICYAVKANTAGRIIRRLAEVDVGADVVSGGELRVALGSHIAPDRIVFSGVAKTDADLDLAISTGPGGILAIQVESIEEIDRIEARAVALQRRARVSIRVNPAVAADTHAHIATGHDEAKFGVPLADVAIAHELIVRSPSLDLVGASSHVGSQLTDTRDYEAAADVLARLVAAWRAAGSTPRFIDFGGGFGIDYGAGCDVTPADFARVACRVAARHRLDDLTLVSEPGRSLVASHGVLVARVLQAKRTRLAEREGRWLLIDAGMNDLLRPALYQARHRIEPLQSHDHSAAPDADISFAPNVAWRVAGPICESSDDFGVYDLPDPAPSHVVLRDTGAYGYTMASEYNGRGLPGEVFLEDGRISAVVPGQHVDEWVTRRVTT